jgi:hypothetical protein
MKENNFWANFHFAVDEVPIIGFLLVTVFPALSLIAQKRCLGKGRMLTLGNSVVRVLLVF